jgi:hypothetical protein
LIKLTAEDLLRRNRFPWQILISAKALRPSIIPSLTRHVLQVVSKHEVKKAHINSYPEGLPQKLWLLYFILLRSRFEYFLSLMNCAYEENGGKKDSEQPHYFYVLFSGAQNCFHIHGRSSQLCV